MKKILCIACLLAGLTLPQGASARPIAIAVADSLRNASADTVVSIEKAHHVVITESDSALVVEIHGQQADSTYSFRYGKLLDDNSAAVVEERATRWDFTPLEWGKKKQPESGKKKPDHSITLVYGAGFGWINAYDAPGAWNFNMGRSIEMFTNLIGYHYKSANRKHTLSAGVGAKFTRLVLEDKQLIEADENLHMFPAQYPEDASDEGASINIATMYLNAIYSWNFTKKWSISFSPMLDFNTRARIKSTYTLGKRKTSTRISGLKRNVVTAEFLATLSYRSVGLYAKYAPWSALDTDFGPKISSWSLGVSLLF